MFFFRKKSPQSAEKADADNSFKEAEDIRETPTSFLGKFLLMIMVIVLLFTGNQGLNDIYSIAPSKQITYCNGLFYQEIPDFSYYENNYCQFNDIEKKFGLDQKLKEIKPQVLALQQLNEQVRGKQQELLTARQDQADYRTEYDLSLQEYQVPNPKAIFNADTLQESLLSSNQKVRQLAEELQKLESQQEILEQDLKQVHKELKDLHTQAKNEAQKHNRIVELYHFLLGTLFVSPLFYFAIRKYFKLKKKNSPYTIIATAVSISFGILLAKVILVFLWEILPWGFLADIFSFLRTLVVIQYFVYYAIAGATIAIFGGIVYMIQKVAFAPHKVIARRLKDQKCPSCSFSLNPDSSFCTNCGTQIKEQCLSCGKLRIKGLPHCPHCGNLQPKTNPKTE